MAAYVICIGSIIDVFVSIFLGCGEVSMSKTQIFIRDILRVSDIYSLSYAVKVGMIPNENNFAQHFSRIFIDILYRSLNSDIVLYIYVFLPYLFADSEGEANVQTILCHTKINYDEEGMELSAQNSTRNSQVVFLIYRCDVY